MNPWIRVFSPFAAGYWLSYVLRNANAVIAPELTRELGLSSADLGLLTAAYLLAFGAFQLPLGLLLDRYGSRRVEAGLLLAAAAGCALFAAGRSLTQLALARGAIGLGVSSCLMASFKAFSTWFPRERLPSVNSAVMVAGSLGALSATTPLSMALPIVGWRGAFLVLSALALAAAVGILSTPEKGPAGPREPLGAQLAALGGIVRGRVFWRYAPQLAVSVGGFMALQGLWAVPWMMHAGGRSRDEAAFQLLLTTVAMMAGFLAIAALVVPLRRRGISPDAVLAAGTATGLAAVLAMLLGAAESPVPWFVLGLGFSAGNLAYAITSSHFPPELAGRVNTALNVGVFAGAFVIQWGYGAALDALAARGWSPGEAHRAALGGLLALQAAAFAWYLARGPRGPGDGPPFTPST